MKHGCTQCVNTLAVQTLFGGSIFGWIWGNMIDQALDFFFVLIYIYCFLSYRLVVRYEQVIIHIENSVLFSGALGATWPSAFDETKRNNILNSISAKRMDGPKRRHSNFARVRQMSHGILIGLNNPFFTAKYPFICSPYPYWTASSSLINENDLMQREKSGTLADSSLTTHTHTHTHGALLPDSPNRELLPLSAAVALFRTVLPLQ